MVVSTCGAAGSLLNMRYTMDGQCINSVGELLFDVVIIDEASQGSEAEVISCIKYMR